MLVDVGEAGPELRRGSISVRRAIGSHWEVGNCFEPSESAATCSPQQQTVEHLSRTSPGQ